MILKKKQLNYRVHQVEKLDFKKNAFKVLELDFIETIILAVNLLYQSCTFTSTEVCIFQNNVKGILRLF